MIVIVMGVTGSGKTTVGSLLADQLHWQFADADSFHPPENVEKMRNGIVLTDEDRQPWLNRLHESIVHWIAADINVVLACSALKRSYRRNLDVGQQVQFVYLKGSQAEVAERLRTRHGHFATESILSGQFADLEEPEDAIVVSIAGTPEEIVGEIRRQIKVG